jgi:hypothetical protein
MDQNTANELIEAYSRTNQILSDIAGLLRGQAAAHDHHTVLLKQILDALDGGSSGSNGGGGKTLSSFTPLPY